MAATLSCQAQAAIPAVGWQSQLIYQSWKFIKLKSPTTPLLGWLAQVLNTVTPSELRDFILAEGENLIAIQMKTPRHLSALNAQVLQFDFHMLPPNPFDQTEVAKKRGGKRRPKPNRSGSCALIFGGPSDNRICESVAANAEAIGRAIPTAPTNFPILLQGLASSARQQKAAIGTGQVSAIE